MQQSKWIDRITLYFIWDSISLSQFGRFRVFHSLSGDQFVGTCLTFRTLFLIYQRDTTPRRSCLLPARKISYAFWIFQFILSKVNHNNYKYQNSTLKSLLIVVIEYSILNKKFSINEKIIFTKILLLETKSLIPSLWFEFWRVKWKARKIGALMSSNEYNYEDSTYLSSISINA